MTDDREQLLRDAVERLHDREPSVDFETAWRRASSRSIEGSRGTADSFRWLLGPAIAAVCAAVIAVIVVVPGTGGRTPDAVASLEGLSVPDAGSWFSDELLQDLELAVEEADDGDSFGDTMLGGGIFVGETDFMINLQIPSFEEDEERNM